MLEKRIQAVGTVGKVLDVLDVVESFGKPVKFNDILSLSPYPKASTYRFLQTLVHENMLSFDGDRAVYSLGSRLIRLAHSAWKQATLAPIAAEYLDHLSLETGQTIHLAQLDGAQVLYLDKRNPAYPISMFSDAGKIGPAYCTGVGKAMMAFLDETRKNEIVQQQSYYGYTPNTLITMADLLGELDQIRKDGIAFDREEHEASIICIAAPILTPKNKVIGGISITASSLRTSFEELAGFGSQLQETAKNIGLGASVMMFPDTEGML